MLVTGEQQQVACFFEIHLGGKEGGAGDLVGLIPLGQKGQGGGKRGARDAIADGMDLLDAQRIANGVDRIDLGGDIIVPFHICHGGIGGFPADHEQAHALIDHPLHEALLFVEIEDVEAVDPGRKHHQRRFEHLVGGRRVMNQLIKRCFMHHLAGRRRDILAQFESVRIGMGQLALTQIAQHML